MAILIASREVLHEFKVCRRITTHYDGTLSFAARLLPFEKRMGIYSMYAMYRRLTNAVSEADPLKADDARQQVQRIRDEIARLYTDEPMMDPALRALRTTVRRFEIPQQLFSDILRATELDIGKTRYRTFEEFRENQSALPLSEITARVLGVSSARAIARVQDLGLALHLTTVLRNIPADFSSGRILIPMEDMLQCGYTEESLGNRIVNDSFQRLLALQIERTRKLYASGLEAIRAFEDDGSRSFVRVLSAIRSAMLDSIEAELYDIFRGAIQVSVLTMTRMAVRGLNPRHDAAWTPDPQAPAKQPVPEVPSPQQSSVTMHKS